MPIEIRMPALSPTMTEGNLARWLKHEGDQVAPGDVIAEIETDKATMEVEAIDEGTLGKIVIGDGTEGVPVNTVIGVLLEEGEDAAASRGASGRAGRAPGRPGGPARGARADSQSQGGGQRRRSRRADLREPAGQAHGQAGGHRSRHARGQWPARADC